MVRHKIEYRLGTKTMRYSFKSAEDRAQKIADAITAKFMHITRLSVSAFTLNGKLLTHVDKEVW